MCQAMGLEYTFGQDAKQLIKTIEARMIIERRDAEPLPQASLIPSDDRLRTRPPAKACKQTELHELLQPFIERGLHVSYPDVETWEMTYKGRQDSGTMRQPPRNVLKCAERLMANYHAD